jgi:hypothetical protein
MYGGLQSYVCGSWFHIFFEKQFKGFSFDHHVYVGYGFFIFWVSLLVVCLWIMDFFCGLAFLVTCM